MVSDQYKIVLKGTIENTTPLIIGCGTEGNTDHDILKDNNRIPFIPGTSLVGVIRHRFEHNYLTPKKLNYYFGFSEDDIGNQSKVIFSDLYLLHNDFDISERDGIKIDNTKGITDQGKKFDYEIIEPGAQFDLKIEIGADNAEDIKKIIKTIQHDLEQEKINIGGKSNLGFGIIKLIDSSVHFYNLKKKEDLIRWLKREDNTIKLKETDKFQHTSDDFEILFDFLIKDSMIIKHYSADPESSDAEHIKLQDKAVIPASSIKGALRARAEKILNTLDTPNKDKLMRYLFGEKLEDEKSSIPSRLRLNEVTIVQEIDTKSIQQRIKIDRFTGGTIDGALFDSQPVFAKDEKTVNTLKLTIKEFKEPEIGLILLLLKDLWSSDLPIGGEKNIGRGVLKGKRIKIGTIEFESINDIKDSVEGKKLQSYVDSIFNENSYKYLQEYDEKFKEVLQ